MNFLRVLIFTLMTCTYLEASEAIKSLPPLGERIYQMDETGVEAARDLTRISASEKPWPAFMRDPGLNAQSLVELSKVAEAPLAPPPKPVVKKYAEISFAKVRIEGRLTKPRVSFSEDRLQIAPVAEQFDLNLIQRLLDSARQKEKELALPQP